MELHLKPELEARIVRIAGETGRDAGDVIEQLLESYLDHDEWFRREVEKGVAQADRGELVEHEEVVRRAERQLREKPRA